ncbi:MAG: CAP domain-containing protein [Anaerolineae bacterium]
MDRNLFSRQNWWRDGLMVLGWLLVVGLAVALVWYSFANEPASSPPASEGDAVVTPSPQATASPTVPAVLPPTATPTATPQPLSPSPTPEPTAIPPSPTPTPYIVAGVDGVNVRTGPDISYEQIGYIDPDGQAEYLGTEDNWMQIRYEGEVAWVYGPLVTVFEAAEAEATAPAEVTEPAETPASTGEVVDWSNELTQLINQQRAAQGLPTYTYNEQLKQAALLHALDCAEHGELTHIGSDGSTLSERVERAGYSSTNVAEITITGPSPQFAIEWWMSETPPDDPHRSQILSESMTEMGVAVVPAGNTFYFVAVMGQP